MLLIKPEEKAFRKSFIGEKQQRISGCPSSQTVKAHIITCKSFLFGTLWVLRNSNIRKRIYSVLILSFWGAGKGIFLFMVKLT